MLYRLFVLVFVIPNVVISFGIGTAGAAVLFLGGGRQWGNSTREGRLRRQGRIAVRRDGTHGASPGRHLQRVIIHWFRVGIRILCSSIWLESKVPIMATHF